MNQREQYSQWWEGVKNSAVGCNEFPTEKEKSSHWHTWQAAQSAQAAELAALKALRKKHYLECQKICREQFVEVKASNFSHADRFNDGCFASEQAIRKASDHE